MLLSSYVYLASFNIQFISITVRFIQKLQNDYYANSNVISYGTYLGDNWHFPIHMGILYAGSTDLYVKDKSFELLKRWQEGSSYMTMIGPHFGLSMDYDDFLVWGAGGLFGLLSLLYSDNNIIRLYFAQQLKKIIDRSRPAYKIINLIWLIHILPVTKEGEKMYNAYIRKSFAEIGHFSLEVLMHPPFCDKNEAFLDAFMKKREEFPSFKELHNYIGTHSSKELINKVQVACFAITTNVFNEEFIERIVYGINYYNSVS